MNRISTFLALASIFTCGIFTSCGGDEDEGDGKSTEVNTSGKPLANPGVFGSSMKRLTSWDGIGFLYYANGGIDSIATPSGRMDGREKFSSDQKTRWVYDLTHSWRDFTSMISYNNNGYISQISSVANEYDADQNVGTQVFFYDNKGHLIQTAYKSTDGNYSGYNTLVWENDTIVRIYLSARDGDEEYGDSYIFEYGGGKYRNKCLQYDGSLLYNWYNDDLQALFILGYFGKGPAYLPTKWTRKRQAPYKDDQYECSFEFNSDGTISYGYGGEHPWNKTIYQYNDK